MYFVYIVECCDASLYTGCTNNIEKRIKEHNEGKRGARYTSTRRPVVLKYTETYKTIGEALKREATIKTWPKKKKLLLFL
ncbi:MAG: putative endonuclease [Patescibacteria group bacterium]|nr:putative endonuclease [Patescibacteria group bacterium]